MSSLSRQLADGQSSGGGGGYSVPGALHALSTDDDGMLTYTRTPYTGAVTETIGANFNSSDSITDALPTSYFNFDSNNSDYDPATGHKLGTTRFDQFYQGSANMYYYIDDDGNLCVRTNNSYTYTGPK
jgi:hypothetical protein